MNEYIINEDGGLTILIPPSPFSCRRQENNGFNQTGELTDGQIKEYINKYIHK